MTKYSDEDIEKLKDIVKHDGMCLGLEFGCLACPLQGNLPSGHSRFEILREAKKILKRIKLEKLNEMLKDSK